MKCDICGTREAVIFVHQSSHRAKTELRLCTVCAKDRGVDRLDGDVSASLSKLLAAVAEVRKPETQKKPLPKSCPRCGSSLAEVRKRGLAGCAGCWEALGDALKNSVEPAFRVHAGRLPPRVAERRAAEEDATRLKMLLAAAIKAEDYETAARCRDRIRELEEGGTARA
jgi:protein arginine kinase activator